MSFARNFALGAQVAGDLLDTYYDAREKSQLRKLSQATPEEIQNAYTTQDAEQLRALANAKDANGNPYYSLEANPDGSYGLKANFSYAGQDGQMVQPGGIATTFTPRSTVVEFLGNRYAPEDLNEDRIAALRARAMTDVISERDPVRGLQMRRAIKSDEREDERFSWERQQQPLRQRGLELQVQKGEIDVADAESARAWKEGFGKHLASYTGSPEQIAAAVPYVNTRSRSITMGTPDPKTGLMPMSVVTPDGNSVFLQLNQADQARLYAAGMMLKTHPVEALKEMSAVNKDLAEALARENQLTKYLVDNNNDVVAKGHSMRVDDQRLALARQQSATPQWELFVDRETGRLVPVDLRSIPRGEGGTGILPGNLVKPSKPLAPVERAKAISDLVDAGYSKEFAAIMVDNMSGGTGLPQPGAAAPAAPAGSDAALVEANNSRKKAANPAASIRPTVVQYSPAAFENFLSGAKRGDPTSIAVVKGWIQSNQLTAGQRKAAEAVVGR